MMSKKMLHISIISMPKQYNRTKDMFISEKPQRLTIIKHTNSQIHIKFAQQKWLNGEIDEMMKRAFKAASIID